MKLNCVNIPTTNLLEMNKFYSLVLNKPYFERYSRRNEILIDNCGIVITYSENKTPINLDSCGLEFIVDDIEKEYNKLIGTGVNIKEAPITLPWNYKYFTIKDPDGNNIDFV